MKNRTLPDLHNCQEVKAAILAYILSCVKAGTIPGNVGMYEALGLSRAQWNHIRNGRMRERASPESIAAIEQGCQMLGVIREQLLLTDAPLPISPWLLRGRITVSDIGDRQPKFHKQYRRHKQDQGEQEE